MNTRRARLAGFARVLVLATLAVVGVASVAVLGGANGGQEVPEGPAYVVTGGPSVSEVREAGALSGDTEAFWEPMAAGDEFYVTTAAHVSGASGTNWKTDLEVHNWGNTQASYTIALLKKDTNNSSPQTANYSLGGSQAARYVDAFSALFGFTGGGALRVTCNSGSIIVTSRTYNDQPGGTYGQFVRGRPLAEGVAYGEQGRLIQLTHNRSSSSGYRTNFMAVNATSGTVQVVADFYAANGSYLGQQQLTLRSYEYKQIDKVFEQVTGGDVADGYAVVSTTTQGGRFFAGCSVIDNRTGDAVFVPHEKATGGGGGGGGNPSYGPLQFSFSVDASCNPINATSSFPYGTTTVYGSFPYSNVTPGQAYERRWYSNGSQVLTGSGTFPNASGRICGSINNASGLNVGTYRLDVLVNASVVLSGEFTVASGGGGNPSYGPLVFSTDVNMSTGEPINPGTNFPFGITVLYASFPYSNVTAGTGWTGKWYVNGTYVATLNRTFPNAAGRQYAALARDGNALDPGTYVFELYVASVVVLQGQCTISGGGGGGGTVNLVPVTPSGWQYPVVPAWQPGGHTVTTLSHYYITYVDWAVGNQGPSNIGSGTRIYVSLLLDGTSIHGWYSDAGLPAGYYLAVEDYQIAAQSIPLGWHTLGVQADPTGTIGESNEGDNTWSHSFEWTSMVFVAPAQQWAHDAASARLPDFAIEPLPEGAIRKLP